MSYKVDISSVSPSSEQRANIRNEGLTLETSALLVTVANLHF